MSLSNPEPVEPCRNIGKGIGEIQMNKVGQIERITQNRVVKLFQDELRYTYLGNWQYRENNSNIEAELLSAYLNRKDYSQTQINKAIDKLKTTANNYNDSLYTTNKKIREAEKVLDAKLYAKYPTLNGDEVKTLVVDDKWMFSIEKAVKSEVEQISQRLTNRIKELVERYEMPLSVIEQEVKELEGKVNAHLEKMGFSF